MNSVNEPNKLQHNERSRYSDQSEIRVLTMGGTLIQQFYPEEYEMFELLASGQTADFVELSAASEFTKHLYNYGLVAKNAVGSPYVKMPVAGRYVAMELAKKEKRSSLYKVIDISRRSSWVENRAKNIIHNLRLLEAAISSPSMPRLFGENSFPEAERFAGIKPVQSESDFDSFFNVCNRCFVESIDNFGKSIQNASYFWKDIKMAYPTLFDVLHRMRVYRHSRDHLKLNPDVSQKYTQFWKEDTYGIDDIDEQRFMVQQRLLESFLSAVLIELSAIR